MLAPMSVIAEGSFLDWASPLATADPDVTMTEERRTRDASLTMAFTWRQTLTLTAGGVYTDDERRVDAAPGMRRYLGGPRASASWFSAESTRYTGPRRALLATAETAYYPQQLSSFTGNITDI